MKRIIFILMTLFFVLMVSSFSYAIDQTRAYTVKDVIEDDAGNISLKMIGKAVSPKKSPYVIVTYEEGEGGYQEDGILISKKHVMIGAHSMCKYLGSLKRVYVKAGDEEINVVDYKMPETFICDDTSCRTDDIMILTLEKPVKSNKPLPILKSAKKIKRGKTVQIAGFGGVDDNDDFGILRQSSTKIENKYSEGFFLLKQYLRTKRYSSEPEGSPAVTVKVKNKKGKKTNAIVGLLTCFYVSRTGYEQDMLMTLQNKNARAFIKKVVGKAAKFI